MQNDFRSISREFVSQNAPQALNTVRKLFHSCVNFNRGIQFLTNWLADEDEMSCFFRLDTIYCTNFYALNNCVGNSFFLFTIATTISKLNCALFWDKQSMCWNFYGPLISNRSLDSIQRYLLKKRTSEIEFNRE